MNFAAPDAFLFDLDGTLVDSERENVESVVLAVRRHGKELSFEERGFVIGHSWNEIYALIARNHSLQVTMPQLIAEAVEEKRELMGVVGHRALPGAVAAVKRFARASKMAVVSGASTSEVKDALAGIGVADYFPVIVAAEDYTHGKPAPEPYTQAITRLGVSAGRSIAIEDATPGILSARAAGARVIAIRAGNFAGYDLSPADLVVDTLDDVTDEVVAGAARVKIDPATLSADAAYSWQAATILPRPIAWTSTLNEDGSANLAPFSFFTGVSADPPTCLICVSRRKLQPDGGRPPKDTWRNIARSGEYVIHVVNDALAHQMNATSRDFPYGTDEIAAVGLTKVASDKVAPPRIAEAPVAMECRLDRIVEVGRAGTAVIIGEILLWHVRDELLVGGRVDLGRLDAIGRLGGPSYARTRDRFDMQRPK